MATHRYLLVFATALFIAPPTPSLADDPAANFVTRLFTEVCIPNLGQPDNVRAWADQKKLSPIDNPEALRVFVGGGNKGAAWYLPSRLGSFALSIRGTTEACAVWAREANITEVDTIFRKIMEGVKRPGLEVSIASDNKTVTASGNTRTVVYQVRATNQSKGFLFTLLTAEKSGGVFQITIQAATASF